MSPIFKVVHDIDIVGIAHVQQIRVQFSSSGREKRITLSLFCDQRKDGPGRDIGDPIDTRNRHPSPIYLLKERLESIRKDIFKLFTLRLLIVEKHLCASKLKRQVYKSLKILGWYRHIRFLLRLQLCDGHGDRKKKRDCMHEH